MHHRSSALVLLVVLSCSSDAEKAPDGADASDSAAAAIAEPSDTDEPDETNETGDTGEPLSTDADADGYPADEDCDDNDPAVNPGAVEVAGDGIDNDCNPETCAGTGFSGAATPLALPEGYADRTFAAAGSSGDCEGDRPRWTLLDITGDGREDIVMVRSPCGDVDPGLTTWTVHPFEDGGYGAAVDWSLPAAIPVGLLQRPGNPAGCSGSSQPRWSLRDFTGDALPDIVVTQSCEDDADVGTLRWRIFANTGTGFADETSFSLPTGYTRGTLDDFSAQPDCDTGRPGYALIDVDGDGDEDLVITTTPCMDGDPGRTQWWVHDNTGTGFADPPTPFTLPGAYPAGTFHAPGSGGSCSAGIPRWSATDLDGDTFVDAVVSWQDCDDPVVGTTEWLVHSGSATGFADAPTTWTLPTGYGPHAFQSIAGDLNCADARPRYQLQDMEADGRPELLVLRSPCEDDDVGTARWLVHRSSGTAFSSSPDEWLLPTGYGDATFHRLGAERQCAPAIPGWLPADPNQDGILDVLIAASACLDDAVGDTIWSVHEGGCAL